MQGEYESREIVLSPGDILVFYSDGLVEAENQQHQLLGYERLANLLLSHRKDTAFGIVNGLISAVTDFTNAAPLDDDLTLVVLKAAPPSDIPAVAEPFPIQGERKPVAVMICHLADKSGEAVDVQEMSSVVGDCLPASSLLAGLHDTYGGLFEPLAQSTLVGLFGVPQTYEDNAQRALAAAWELRARLAEADLSMHAGIHTGTVIFRNPLLSGGGIDIIEIEVVEGAPATERVLANVKFPPQSLIAAVIRDSYVRVPGADDRLAPGDTVVALVEDAVVDETLKLFNPNGGS